MNRRTRETWYASAESTTALREFAFGYDGADRLTGVLDATLDANRNTADWTRREFTYDGLGRLNRDTSSGANRPTTQLDYAYDAADRRTALSVQVQGVVAFNNSYTYDAAGRTAQIAQQTPTGPGRRVEFSYDAAGRTTQVNRSVRQANDAWTAPLTTAFSYDAQGRLVKLDHASENGAAQIESYRWTYDARNRLSSASSLFDGLTTYAYDERDQLIGVDREGTAQDETYAYDANGNRISATASPQPRTKHQEPPAAPTLPARTTAYWTTARSRTRTTPKATAPARRAKTRRRQTTTGPSTTGTTATG